MIIDAKEHYDGSIEVWFRAKGELHHIVEENVPYYCYVEDDQADGSMLSIYRNPVRKCTFDTKKEFNDFVSNHQTFESGNRIQKYLSDTFYRHTPEELNVTFIDIEADYDLSNGNGYPTVENPHGIVNAVTVYHKWEDKFYLLYVGDPVDIDTGDDDITIFNFKNERGLLIKLYSLIEDSDILSGWNSGSIGYDIPYLYNRSCIVFGKKSGSTKLCRNGHPVNIREKVDRFGNTVQSHNLIGRVSLDYMELYAKFYPNELPSLKLENVAQQELGYGKIDYDGDLGDLYRTDLKRFLEYNIHDVRLLRDLDRKRKYISQVQSMVSRATVRYDDALGSIKYIEGVIRNYSHFDRKDGVIVLPDKQKHDSTGFEGAFVFETISGVYKWVSTVDLTALYPSTIRTINISPETMIGQCVGGREDMIKIVQQDMTDVTVETVEGEEVTKTAQEWNMVIREHNMTISANGTLFHNLFVGLIPEVLEEWAGLRNKYKKKMAEAYKAGDMDKVAYYDQSQSLEKLTSNSLYGCISNQYSVFFDLRLAQSVTLTGQMINKQQAVIATEFIRKNLVDR